MEAILILTGMLIGIGVSTIIHRAYYIGTLRIDHSDPSDSPYMFLEIEKGIKDISRKKHVVLKVKREDFIPHE